MGISGPQATGGPVRVDVGGLGIPGGDPVWNGSNQGGQWVANGVYYLKVSSADPFGITTTITVPVDVLGVENRQSVQVFNSAGEVVRAFDLSAYPAVQSISMSLPLGQAVVPASVDPATGRPCGGLTLTLALANGRSLPLVWDGLGGGGAPLQAGTYMIELVSGESGAADAVKALSVALLQPKDSTAQAVAASAKVAPNPAPNGGAVVLRYTPNTRDWVLAKLYNQSGELVGQAVETRSGTLGFAPAGSGGIYLVDFEVCQGSVVVARRLLKAAVLP